MPDVNWDEVFGLAPAPDPWQSIINTAGGQVDNGVNYVNNNSYPTLPPVTNQDEDAWANMTGLPRAGYEYQQSDELGGKGSQFYAPQDNFSMDRGFANNDMESPIFGFNTYQQKPIAALLPQTRQYPPDAAGSYIDTWQYMMGNNAWNGFTDKIEHYQPDLGPSW